MTWLEWAQQLKGWPGWRRHAPAVAGSAAFHLAAVGLVAATLGAASGAPSPAAEPETFIAIELINQPPDDPPPQAGVTPPRAPTPRPAATDQTAPIAPATPDPRRRQTGPAAPEPSLAAPGDDSVYIPPSIYKGPGPAGLQGLAGRGDPCADPLPSRRPRGCPSDLAARVGSMDTTLARSQDDLAQHYGDYMPKCALRVGCGPDEKKTILGSRAVDNNGMAAGGAGSLGGMHDSVGRLGFNPDHRDPGFGD